jgi:chloramphenicol 3-O phosphotransferase
MAEEGLDIVVDHVLLDPAWANDLETKLHGLDLFRVGVRCPLEAVRQREASRRDRTLGQAEAQYHVVHRVMRYDVEVDTATRSPEECAGLIVAAMRFAERPTG